ncbi:Nitrogen regulation protein NIFR3 [Staphylococcus aureus]|nr:Nitrogen regulation protein NIFR3 [Staphylococcus aureus]
MQVGDGPQQREFRKEILQAMQVGVWAPTKRISKRNSTGNASWGVGTNTEADEKSAYNNVQVGDRPQQREIGFPISTDNASRRGPNTEAVTNDKILLHNKSLVVLYHYCLPFLIVMMHNNLSSNCRIKLYLISNYP